MSTVHTGPNALLPIITSTDILTAEVKGVTGYKPTVSEKVGLPISLSRYQVLTYFYSRDTMPVQYMLRIVLCPSVCLSVCHKPVFIETADSDTEASVDSSCTVL